MHILLLLRKLRPRGLKPLLILHRLPVPLFQDVDFLDPGENAVLTGLRIVGVRQTVHAHRADARHLLPFRRDLLVGVVDDEFHAAAVLDGGDGRRPLVQILPNYAHGSYLRKND